jgi:hypothetical protein
MSELSEVGSTKTCKLESCDRTFEIKKSAPHQEFCSSTHRIEWHNARRKKAEELLLENEKGKEP